jgi:phage tail sheath protein FI
MVQASYPGVYLQEIPSGVRTITGVATSVTAFVGYTSRGLDNRAKRVFSFAEFERAFGGLDSESELSYAVQHFFANGGGEAVIVRTPKADATAATVTLLDDVASGKSALKVTAISTGAWGNSIVVEVDYDGIPDDDDQGFNLVITDLGTGTVEEFDGVTMDPAKANYVVAVLNDEDSGSELVTVEVPDDTAGRPAESGTVGGDVDFDDLKNDKAYLIKISSDLPAGAIANEDVTVIDSGETLPTSILGLCRLIERKINLALKDVADAPGASVRCVPSSSGLGVRVIANFPDDLQAHDAELTFAAGSPSALGAVKLSTVTANVGRYWLGSPRGAAFLAQGAATPGEDGTELPHSDGLIGNEAAFTGIYALEKVDLFNLLCIPDATRADPGNSSKLGANVDPNSIFAAAMTYVQKRRAFLLIDPPPEVNDVEKAADWKSSGLTVHEKDGAAFFPRLRLPDSLNDFAPRTFAPCGVVAGLMARIDASRGVWKAPAGTEATLTGVQSLVYKLTDAENGALNPLGLNCFRNFPIYGNVAWGARTLVGADAEGSEWKYIPVRRVALYLEESLFRGTKWVVFEPNDEALWAQIRLNIGAFMQSLFRQGAFQGKTPKEAYLVKCDKETTTQDDINKGIVNILVGFAPLKPAEFVFIKIQQLAGQIQA